MNPVGVTQPRGWKNDLRPREGEGQTPRGWTEGRWVLVQCALLKWPRRPEEQSLFSTWLSEKEDAVSKSHTSGFKDQGEMFSSL